MEPSSGHGEAGRKLISMTKTHTDTHTHTQASTQVLAISVKGPQSIAKTRLSHSFQH